MRPRSRLRSPRPVHAGLAGLHPLTTEHDGSTPTHDTGVDEDPPSTTPTVGPATTPSTTPTSAAAQHLHLDGRQSRAPMRVRTQALRDMSRREAVVLAAIAALLLLACAAWAFARSRAYEPHWLVSLRHAMAEAGYPHVRHLGRIHRLGPLGDSRRRPVGPSKMRGHAAACLFRPTGGRDDAWPQLEQSRVGVIVVRRRRGKEQGRWTQPRTPPQPSSRPPAPRSSIERFFTSPDTHPFDTVEWELPRRAHRPRRPRRVRADRRRVPHDVVAKCDEHRHPEVLPRPARPPRARALGQADDRPRRRHDRRLGPRARLLRHRRGRATPSRPS